MIACPARGDLKSAVLLEGIRVQEERDITIRVGRSHELRPIAHAQEHRDRADRLRAGPDRHQSPRGSRVQRQRARLELQADA